MFTLRNHGTIISNCHFFREISKRVLLAKFFSPGCSVFQFIPISMFNWQMNGTFPTTQSAEHITESMQKTNCEISSGSSFEDISIWILISTAPDLESEHEVKGLGTCPTGLWRLALMTKEMIIMGNTLDPRYTQMISLCITCCYAIKACVRLMIKFSFRK